MDTHPSQETDYREWKNWDNNNFLELPPHDNAYFKHLFKKHNIRNGASILEVGFGNGAFLKFASDNNHLIEGIEVIEPLLELAQENSYTTYRKVEDIPASNEYDLIIMFDVLEHIQQEEIPLFLQNIRDSLSDNGLILIRTPNGSSPLGLSNQHGDITHVTIVTEPKINYWCHQSRLELLKSSSDPYPFIIKHRPHKSISIITKLLAHMFIEKIVRFISPQSKGVLSSNIIFTLKKS